MISWIIIIALYAFASLCGCYLIGEYWQRASLLVFFIILTLGNLSIFVGATTKFLSERLDDGR